MPRQDIFKSLEFERIVLALWLRSKVLRSNWVTKRNLVYENLFSSEIHRKIYKAAERLIEKNPKVFEPRLLVRELKKRLKTTDFDIAVEIVKKISKVEADRSMFPMFREELVRMEEARKYFDLAREVTEDLKDGDVDGAKDRIQRLTASQMGSSIEVVRGEVLSDWPEHEQYFYDYKHHPEKFWGIGSGIPLFDKVTGGSRKGRLYLIAAITKRGKSVFLVNISHSAARAGKFVVYMTTEMSKMEVQHRFMSLASGVPFDDLNSPKSLSEKQKNQAKKALESLREDGGLFYALEFKGRSCTVPKVASTCQIIEQEIQRPIDMLVVDHMHDMIPIGRFGSERGWDAYGEISWDLSRLAKDFCHITDPPDAPTGVPVWTANQAKTASEFYKKLTRQDIAYSPLPPQHASCSVYLAATEEDEERDRLRFGFLDQGRFGGTSDWMFLYPNKKVINIHDRKRIPAGERESSEGGWDE